MTSVRSTKLTFAFLSTAILVAVIVALLVVTSNGVFAAEPDRPTGLTVTAEDASTQTYTVPVTRPTPSTAVPAVITVSAQSDEEPWKAPVTGLSVSAGDTPGDLNISWTAHPENAEEYRVTWAPSGEDFRPYGQSHWNAYPTGTSHRVTGLEPNTEYKVKVRSRFGDGERSAWTDAVVGSVAGAAPSNVGVSGKTVTLTPATAVTGSDMVTVSYTVAAADPIQDTSGNQSLAPSNQALTYGAPTSRSVAENTAAGVDIGLPVVATGSSGAVTYTLGGTDAASFEIVAATGQLQTKAALDYETRSGYEVTVTATDTDDSVTTTVAIEVTNVTELTSITGPSSVEFLENSWSRVATFTASSEEDRADIQWIVGGADSGHFSMDNPPGALRFALDTVAPRIFSEPPDFEAPVDGDAANTYELTLFGRVGSTLTDRLTVTVTVSDVDEDGAITLSSTRPRMDVALTATLNDPDGVTAGTVTWQWERSTGRNAWAVIEGAASASYTPVAADTNTFLRVTATYADEHGTGKTVSEVAPNVVTGPLLTGLTAETDDSRADTARGLYPAFDPQTLHYGIGCNSTDTLVLTVSAAANARVAVAGVQAASAPMAVDVSEDSDVAIRVTDASGAGTTYVVHCLPEVFFEIETHTFPNTDAFEDLILFSRDFYLRALDRNGVPRLRLGLGSGSGTFAVRFHRVGADGAYRYGFWAGSDSYTILDEDFEVVDDDVSTVAPLTRHNSHDFQILEDGNYLVMAYERATRDFSDIDLPYFDGADVSSVGVNDAAVQIVTPGRRAVFTWNSWGNMAIEDCVQHRFPVTLSTDPDMRSPDGGYAHINGMHVVDGVLAASMRGCSKVLGIDVKPGVTRGDVLWRMGRTNLSDAEWTARDIGPRPLDFINDPEGEFCGQHTARFLPNGNVFLFDNGVVCLIDPWTFDASGRAGNDFSRAVEYALDLENHEAVFVRDHSLRGERSHVGYANGNVDVLDNGDWLVSWGRPLDVDVTIPDNERATLVDPATGQEKLGIRFRELPADERQRRINATVAPAEVLAPQPVPLTAEFPASDHTSLFHTGSGDAPQVVVAFSRPVVDFDGTTPSLSVTGATVASVSPHLVAGEAANAYLVTLTPEGDGEITLRLVAGEDCADGGFCTADGTMLTEVPPALVIGPPPSVAFERATYSVGEGATLTVGLRLSAAHQNVLEVVIPVILDTSESASEADITAEESVTFGAGETRKTLSIRAIDDDLVEGSESAILRLGELPDGITAGATTEVAVTVTDPDRATISFTVPTLQVAEGGHAPLTFAITNGATFQRDQTITLTVGGTATAGADFTIAGGDNRLLSAPYSLVFPAGASFITATVRAVDDTDTEPTTETVTAHARLDLNSASLGTRTVTIAPSDPAGAPVITGSPVAAGSPRVGETLEADTSAITLAGGGRPAPFSYDWVADGDRGRAVTARNIYRIQPDDAGFTISVGVGIKSEDGSVQLVRSATTSTIAAAVPASPGIVNATVGDPGSLHLTWEAPTWDVSNFQQGGSGVGDGGSPITGYTVQWKESTASWETAAAVTEATVTTTSHAITGLTAGTAYTVRVVAINSAGDSSPSPEVTVQDTVVNRGPVIVGSVWVDYAENGTGPVHTFLARDPESDTVTWSLAGDDSGAFSITGGVLRFAQSPDYEDPNHGRTFRVTVQAADATNRTTHDVAIIVTNANEAPVVNGDAAPNVDENTETFSRTYAATDPEGAASTFTWSLSGTDGGDFNIDTSTGELTFRNTPDYENPADSNRNNEYLVQVRATDEGNLRGMLDVTVTVNDVNEPPTITGDETLSFPENSVRSVATYRASDPERDTITWSVSGVDGGAFNISETGVLTFASVPDFENPDDADGDNDYEVTVQARDDEFSTASLEVVVTVTNSSGTEEPTITTISRPVLTYQENGTGTVYTYHATDPQRGTITWTLEGDDAGDFLISESGALTFRNPPDFERPADQDGDNVYEITVMVTDEQDLTDRFHVTIIVTNHHENLEPAITTGSSSGLTYHQLNYQENRTATVYTYSARNYGSGSMSWSVSGTDAGDFDITTDSSGRGVLTFGSTPDFESPDDLNNDNDYEITVVVTNTGGYTDRLDVVVTVTDVNEGPEITSGGNSFTVPENQAWAGASFTASDPEGEAISRWNLGGRDGGDFTISENGVLTFRSIPDYERPDDGDRDNIYEVEVRPYDGRYYGSHHVTVTVTPINEAPTITTTSSSATVLRQNENQTSRLYTYRATDPESSTVTWSVGGTDGRFFTIDERGQFSFSESSPPDFEQPEDSGGNNVYEVTIQARDDGFNTASLPVTVTVREVNEGPEVTGGRPSFTIDENQDLPNAIYAATDPEGGTVARWTVGGTDGGDFTISEEGELTFRNLPDYERPADSNKDNIYELQVRPYDGRYYGSFDVRVTVNDVNEPPTITTTSSSATSLRQNENQTSRLYTYRATDPERSTVTWSVAGVDGRFFAIDEQGQFSFKEETPPDFEQPGDQGRDNVYDVTVQARDDGGNTASLPVTVTVREVNEGPEVTGGQSAFIINENQDLPGATYTATDPEGGSVTRWNLGGSDGGDFTISGAGVLTFRNLPDYERPADGNKDNVYELQVRPYDGRYYGSFDVTVTVSDVNEPPTIITTSSSATALQQRENQTSRLYTYRATDPEGSTVTWSVGGADERFFAIDDRGQFSFSESSSPDFEQPGDSGRDNVYEVTIQARDDGSNTRALSVTVTVTNDAESVEPTISTRNPPSSYRENGTSAVYTFRASDPQRQSITWSLEGEDRGDFTLTEDSSGRGTLAFSSPPDYENPADADRQNDYELTVIATDEDGHRDWLSFTVTVTEVNEGPEVSGPSTFTIAENRRLSNAGYTATDPEGQHIARWSVGGRDGGDFFITQGGTLYFRSLPDYDRPADSDRDNVYEVSIQPSDGRVLGSYPVTVTVTDVNEAPEIRSGSATSFTQQENRTSRLYTYSATDPEEGAVTWSVGGTDGNNFTIDERGQFSFREENPPDFDTPADDDEDNVYNVTIQARDPESNTASLSVTVTVTEVNEGPVITRQGSAQGSVPENHSVTQVLATYTAVDPERPSVRITGWSTSGTDGGDFTINALGELRFRNSPDYERPVDANRDNVYEVTIRASDGRNTGTLEEVQVVTVTDVNEPPTITTTSRTAFSQQENRTSTLYTFRATDPEGATVTWSAGGTDGRYFAIDDQGRFSFREDSPPDFDDPDDAGRDNAYNVTVQASDDASNSATLDVTVTVTDHNESVEPTISTRRPPSTYRENGTAAVYTFRANDPQSGTTITWSLTGTDAGDFTITTDGSGRGVLAFASSPDFESPADSDRDNSYESAVVATDDEGNTDRVDFTITVTNYNEGVEPTISTRRPPSTYRENNTSAVYTFRASDPQSGTTISWSLTGTDAGDFTITVDTSGRGVLTFNSVPDFESPADSDQDNEYELAAVAADGDGNSNRVDFTITVTDVNEPPVVTLNGTATTTVPENTSDTQVLARYTARDPENPTAGIYRWSTTGRDGGDFVMSELGELRFRASPDFERPADSDRDNVYEVTVRASDGSYYGMPEETLNITVTQVNEAPVITTKSRTEFSLRENSTSTIYTYRATDQDDSDTIRWSVEGADGGDFAIHNGVLTFRLLPDLENPVDSDEDNVYEITVVAADSASLRDTVEATITITDQSEGPLIAGTTSYTVAENYDITRALGTFTATDAKDGRAVHPQWSLSGRDGGDFLIDRSSGTLTFRNTPDYDRPADSDRDNVYEVTVRGHDSQAYGNLNVTVTVTNINEAAPVITGRNSHTVRENTASAFYTYRATDSDLNDTIAWSVEGTDGDDFTIDENGALSFTGSPDYESPADSDSNNVYALSVVATDGGGLRGTFAVVVSVTELNEGPVVTGTASFTVNENQDLSGATYSASDPEATGGVTTTITWSVSGRDGGDFTIDRETGVLTFRTLPDHERPADGNHDNEYEVTVRAYDGRNYGTFDVTVTVLDVSEIVGSSSLDRAENFTGLLATYAAAGQGALDVTPAWRLTGTDGGDFSIDEQGQLTFRYSPDHERPADSNRDNVYEFVVQVSDGSYYETLDVTITVTPVNEHPAITGRKSLSFRENTPVTTSLYTYRATDPEGEDFTWQLGGLDAGDFSITSDSSGRGVLTFASPPNFDSPTGSGTDGNEYLVTVQARDDQGNTGEFPVTITVTDQNEGATVSGRTEIAVQENRDATLVLATYTASDPEGQAITRWSLGGSDAGDFSISEDGELTFRNTPDYDRPADSNRDNEYLVTVRAYDGSAYGNLDVTVTVSNQNEHDPVIRSGSRTSFSYREESTSTLYSYSATDQDKDDTITWTTTGTDAHLFEFDDRNALSFREPPDYEDPRDAGLDNEYELAVVATDSGGRSHRLDVTVSVTEVDEGPEITGATAYIVAEGQELSGATFSATDPEDPTIEVTNWRTSGTDGGDFTMSEDGELSFRSTPDYERPADSNRDNVYIFTVQVSDGSNYGSLDVTVTVTDLNETDPEVSGRDTLSVRENTTSTLYTYSARDMDRGAEITWSVRGNDSDDFTIGENGELSFSSSPDHERPADFNSDNVYEVTAVASDGTNEGFLDVTVTVTPVNEGPEISGRDTLTVSENYDEVLGTYSGTDPEDTSAEITSWSVTGRDGGDFTINDPGELTFRNPPDYERPADSDRDNEYEVTVRASDGQVYGTYDVTVTVEAVDEAPEFQSGSRDSFSYRENGTSTLYTYRATDPEVAEVTWSVSGSDGEDFSINTDSSGRGVLSFEEPPDYDDPADDDDDNEYELTVVATDQTGHEANLSVTVTVTNVNEGPTVSGTAEYTVRENHELALGTYTARDPEDPGLEITRWSVTGRDGGDFAINEDGELSFRSPPDYERPADGNRDNVYEVIVRASDGSYYGNFEVTVTVEAVNEPPDITGDEAISYQENGDRALETYRATDPEKTDITWGLSGVDAGAFAISETGVLTFRNVPDYEGPADSDDDNVYEVTVEATDEDGETGRLEAEVTVTNVTD